MARFSGPIHSRYDAPDRGSQQAFTLLGYVTSLSTKTLLRWECPQGFAESFLKRRIPFYRRPVCARATPLRLQASDSTRKVRNASSLAPGA